MRGVQMRIGATLFLAVSLLGATMSDVSPAPIRKDPNPPVEPKEKPAPMVGEAAYAYLTHTSPDEQIVYLRQRLYVPTGRPEFKAAVNDRFQFVGEGKATNVATVVRV